MDSNDLKRVINIIISIIIAILLFKLFIWALPIIIIIFLAHYIYKKIKNSSIENKKDTWQRTTKTTKVVKRNKKIIIDEEKD